MHKKSPYRSKTATTEKDDERAFTIFIVASLVLLAVMSLYAGLYFA